MTWLKLAAAVLGVVGLTVAPAMVPAPAPAAAPLGLGQELALAGRVLAVNGLYVLAGLVWSVVGLLVLDHVGILRPIDFAEEIRRGNLAAAVVAAALILGIFGLCALTFR